MKSPEWINQILPGSSKETTLRSKPKPKKKPKNKSKTKSPATIKMTRRNFLATILSTGALAVGINECSGFTEKRESLGNSIHDRIDSWTEHSDDSSNSTDLNSNQETNHSFEIGQIVEVDGTQNFTYRGRDAWTAGLPGDILNGGDTLQYSNRTTSSISASHARRGIEILQAEYGIENIYSVRNAVGGDYEHSSFDNVQSAATDLDMDHKMALLRFSGNNETNSHRFDAFVLELGRMILEGSTLVHCREGEHRSVNIMAAVMFVLDNPEITPQDRRYAERFNTTPERVAAYRHIGEPLDNPTYDSIDKVGDGRQRNVELLLANIDRLRSLRSTLGI